MLLVYIAHTAILRGWWNAHIALSFACPTSELKAYSDKPLQQKSVQRLWKNKDWWRAKVMNCYKKLSTDEERYNINMLLKT